ncbi:hypothetical protein [Ruegeria lacuscaerulensis]|uniref:hypothetical protein n=1 Tax=Ruegeria lacuscaerulensis TaxID=55218 RepID=UPI00147D6136|nr:hypothetical protein [Ruegeria lacuscaerulensis]
MANRLQQPVNPYDPAWVEYRRQNPGLRLSLSAADPSDTGGGDGGDGGDGGALQADYSFIPDTFKKEDGTYDTEGFSNQFNELSAFKSQHDERISALPQKAEDYAFKVGEGFQFPEGFDPTEFQQPVLGEDGNPVMVDGKIQMREFDVNDMIDAKDPDLPALQAVLHKHQVPQELMGELAGILAGRELRGMIEASKAAKEEKQALGPDAQTRIDVVKRSLSAKLPEAQANALADDITSADTLRAIEAILKPGSAPVSPAPGNGLDLDNMTPREMIEVGMKQQMAGK